MARDGTNRGRPTDLTPEIQDALCAAIEKGVPIKYACAEAGIHPGTYYGWVTRGEKDLEDGVESIFSNFFNANARARYRKTEKALSKLWQMADEYNAVTGQRDPKFLMWLLERQEPEDFGPKSKTEISGPNGGPVQMTLADIVRSAMESDEKAKE